VADRPLPVLAWAAVEGDPSEEHGRFFGRRFRRIGAFVKLAQVAAARCLTARPGLDPSRAGLFIGTGLGNTADIVPLAEGVLHPSRPRCSPMSFAGCLGNAASFFVAQSTGCLGPNVTLSQEELSFEAALFDATLALRAGRVDLALVGGVDVISGSADEQRRRMNAAEAPGRIVQGAAFLLLAARGGGPAQLEEAWLGSASMGDLLTAIPEGARVLPGWRLAGEPLGPDAEPVEDRLLPVASALRVVEALDAGPGRFVHLQRNTRGTAARLRLRRV
jgi:hypothetical protein